MTVSAEGRVENQKLNWKFGWVFDFQLDFKVNARRDLSKLYQAEKKQINSLRELGFTGLQIKFIEEKLISYFKVKPKIQNPLKKINILDIGCGGGLLCEPLKKLGASVTGIDASKNNIEAAKLHAKKMNLKINYIHCSPENFLLKNKFDVILNMEVIEHVSDVDLFIHNCSRLIKKNGIMFVATINKNLKS